MCSLKINKHFLDMTSCLNTLSIIVMKTESFTNTQSIIVLAYKFGCYTALPPLIFLRSLHIISLQFYIERLIKRIILYLIFLFFNKSDYL